MYLSCLVAGVLKLSRSHGHQNYGPQLLGCSQGVKNSNNMKISMMVANLARKNIDKEHTKLMRLQEEMVVLVSKKPMKTE